MVRGYARGWQGVSNRRFSGKVPYDQVVKCRQRCFMWGGSLCRTFFGRSCCYLGSCNALQPALQLRMLLPMFLFELHCLLLSLACLVVFGGSESK